MELKVAPIAGVVCDTDQELGSYATHFWSMVCERLSTSESSMNALSSAVEKACAMVLPIHG
jgi:hypothetical protein